MKNFSKIGVKIGKLYEKSSKNRRKSSMENIKGYWKFHRRFLSVFKLRRGRILEHSEKSRLCASKIGGFLAEIGEKSAKNISTWKSPSSKIVYEKHYNRDFFIDDFPTFFQLRTESKNFSPKKVAKNFRKQKELLQKSSMKNRLWNIVL